MYVLTSDKEQTEVCLLIIYSEESLIRASPAEVLTAEPSDKKL